MLDKLSTYAFPTNGMACYYHTASVRNALDILEFNHLFGSFPSKVNDPDDLRMSIENLDKSPYLLSWARGLDCAAIQKGLCKEVKAIMDRTYRFVCFSEASKVDSDEKSELYFWNEYADHFKGVRLKFLLDKNFSINPSANDSFVGKIVYKGHTATIDASHVRNMQDFTRLIEEQGFLDGLCYSKSPNWASEYEVRIGCHFSRLKLEMSHITSREERFFSFNLSSLKEVSVGYAADEVDIGKLKLSLRKINLPLHVVKTDLHYETL